MTWRPRIGLEENGTSPPQAEIIYSLGKNLQTCHHLHRITEKALSASKNVKFENPHKPDLVVEFFKNHGFTQTQISSVVRKFPPVLMRDTQKILLPKLEFLKSRGVSSADVARIVSTNPFFLKSSLDNTIIPAFDFLSNLCQSQAKAIAVIQRYRRLSLDQLTRMSPNIETLRETGVSDSSITYLLIYEPGAFMVSYDRFRRVVEKVEKIGFSPSKVHFVVAIKVLCMMTKSTWNKKVEVYRKWGLTEDEIFVTFKRQPWFMTKSEDKDQWRDGFSC
ncbi:transcription termination factor MTERF5, chloroplastic-like [Rhododendron vialii]|uniref:transcription termination factor MTERF5, chloroplastic-like n=1 Tax=Rhododendron vialii TaxID=182163 RepID=UPI0026601CC9|nr:transcription termination factor MTERF5, chloroplastic-like [Rhododendron vialii]